MNHFYAGTSIFGIVLIIVSIILIMLDKKKDADYIEKMKEEELELSRVISDSEQMLEELNRFSDYVINQVDKRSSQLGDMLKKFDEKMEEIEGEIGCREREEQIAATVTYDTFSKTVEEQDNAKYGYINSRHREVIDLVEKGMSDTDIARALNMGKGEVQLILGMNIHKLK